MAEVMAESLRLQREAAVEGFDWPELAALWPKLQEEISELREATTQGQARVQDELGDLLFMVMNLARHLNVDPVLALGAANGKFARRFAVVLDGRQGWEHLSGLARLDAMEDCWREAKRRGL